MIEQFEGSTPNIEEFNPCEIKFQAEVIHDIRCKFDYSLGCHHVFLSGSVGSAKSLLLAHIIVTHCLDYPGANVGIGRLSKPALKTTLIDNIIKHLRGFDDKYTQNKTSGNFEFTNGSKITAYSWSDNNYNKVRSEQFSLFAIEELTENDTGEAYKEIRMRMNRRPDIPENILISATNPDEPDHWAYKTLIETSEKQHAKNPDDATIHVYYSVTSDNPFLAKSYITQLMDELDELMVQRMIFGRWISIRGDKIYYNYDPKRNRIHKDYKIDLTRPIGIGFDFNIGVGKPMSCCLFQYEQNGETTARFDVFAEVIVHGADTEQLLLELADNGHLDHKTKYEIYGDATGRARNSASKKSDYDVIQRFLDNYRIARNFKEPRKLIWSKHVPLANPPIRTRHNLINGLCKNANNKVNLYLWEKCNILNEGLRLAKLLKGAKYQEDDSKEYQHVTTALGYAVVRILNKIKSGQTETIQL